jgi:hypothetical protein
VTQHKAQEALEDNGLGTEKKHLLTVHLLRMRILAAPHIFY